MEERNLKRATALVAELERTRKAIDALKAGAQIELTIIPEHGERMVAATMPELGERIYLDLIEIASRLVNDLASLGVSTKETAAREALMA